MTILAFVVLLRGLAFQETQVELKNVNVCCANCEKVALKALEKAGIKGRVDQKAAVVTFAAADLQTAQKALDALAADGLHGDTGRSDLAMKDDSGVRPGLVPSLTLTTHNCCPQCVKRLRSAIVKVDGVESDDAKPRVSVFTVKGKFDGAMLVKALHDAGFHVKTEQAPEKKAAAYPAWDGKESVAEYAKRAGLPASRTLDLGDGVTLEMILIPAGSFLMGSPDGETKRPQEEGQERQHRVTLSSPYYLARHELTQAQFEKLAGANPSSVKNPAMPVTDLTWDDAAAFCAKAAKILKRDLRLPTEAQWEFACRAGSTTAFYTGAEEQDLDKAGWYGANSGKAVHRGGEKAPNGFGLFDMLGNVREFCSDWYAPYDGKDAVDPQGPETGEKKVSKGGAYAAVTALICRSATRTAEPLTRKNQIIGLRPLMSADRE